jgi:DNA repair exonuclease SbcCD ATPase subunit
MRLTKIELRSFKRFADFRARFSPGINVVKGPLNEMGKSTLLEGIVVALFENPKSTARDVRDYTAWGSTRQFQTSLEFEEEGKRYLLEKDFQKGTVRLSGEDAGDELGAFRQISERLSQLLGTKSDKLFLCSCCVRQSQVAEISSGKKEISESLEEVVTGGRESVLASQVIQKLDSRIADAKKGLDKPAKNPGILAALKSRLQDASLKHSQVRDEVSAVERQKVELVEMNRQLALVKDELDKCTALLDKNRKRREIEATLERLGKEYERVEELLGRIRKHEEDMKKADEVLAAGKGFADRQQVSDLRKALDAMQNRRADIEKDLAQRQQELEELRRKPGRGRARFLGSPASIAAAVALFAGGLVGAIVGNLYLLALVVLGAILFALAQRARSAIDRDRSSMASLEERIQRMKGSLEELGKDEQGLLSKAGCSTLIEFDEREKGFHSWLQKREEAKYRLEEILRGRTPEAIEKRRLELARDQAVERERLTEDLKQTEVSPEQYVELERKVKSLQVERDDLDDRRRNAMATVRAAGHDAEDQVRLEEEIENLREALRHEERKVRTYELARDFISRARIETLSSAHEALEGEIQRYFAIFTDGKYEKVRVNKDDLEFWVYSEEKGDWVRPEELSGGAVDEFYLAFRLALVKLIFGDKRPPLIMDDPFVNFDSVRLANTLNFLKTLASDYQIIVFTLSDLYDDVTDSIVLLPGDRKLL